MVSYTKPRMILDKRIVVFLAYREYLRYRVAMQRFRFLSVMATNVLLFGCGHRPETGESIAEVCQESNNGKLKNVSGYIGASPTATFCTTTCNLKLRAQKGVEGREMDATFAIGTDNNELEELPNEFTDKDIRIKDDTGKQIHGGDVVRITGRVSVSHSGRNLSCSIAATKVEGQGFRGLL